MVFSKKTKLTLSERLVSRPFWSLFHRHCNEWNLHFVISQVWSLFHRRFIVHHTAWSKLIVGSSLVHRWENFWLFKLLLLMDASAYYVKHRCNTTKHPQEFFLTNKFLLSVFTVFFWNALYWFWEKSVDWFNMFHLYPNSKISFIQNQLAAWG